MGGGIMQLVAYGAQDVYLTGNPQITFFKTTYRRHTNFSMECVRQTLEGSVAAGSRVIGKLTRNGDLVHDCFIKYVAHGGNHKCGYNPGHNMIDNIECEIGGQLIDKHYGHWMEAHAELTEGVCSRYDTDETEYGEEKTSHTTNSFQLTACAGGVRQHNSSVDSTFFVPLRFWFNRHIGLSLPLIALQYHEVNINITFTSGESAQNILNGGDPSLWCNYIYLDTDERRRFAQVSHEYLIEQVQLNTFTGHGPQTFQLNFNHPVKELIWVGLGSNQKWGESTTTSGHFIYFNTSHTDTTQLKLNGLDRFEKLESAYFSRYQVYKYHSGIPGSERFDEVNVYSFALKPEEHQPSGTCNFSRIDNSQLIFSNIQSEVVEIFVYAVNYNVLRIMSGMGGLAYSS